MVAYYLHKFRTLEINYLIYDKELVSIISAFKEWRPSLAGAQHHVHVVTDHKKLLYFSSTNTLTHRQAQWTIFLLDYDFKITFRPWHWHNKADALSKRTELATCLDQQPQCMLTPDQVQIFATYVLQDKTLLVEITMTTTTNHFVQEITQEINAHFDDPTHRSHWDDLEKFSFQDGVLLRNNLVQSSLCHRRAVLCSHYNWMPQRFVYRLLWVRQNFGSDLLDILVAPIIEASQRLQQDLWHLCLIRVKD